MIRKNTHTNFEHHIEDLGQSNLCVSEIMRKSGGQYRSKRQTFELNSIQVIQNSGSLSSIQEIAIADGFCYLGVPLQSTKLKINGEESSIRRPIFKISEVYSTYHFPDSFSVTGFSINQHNFFQYLDGNAADKVFNLKNNILVDLVNETREKALVNILKLADVLFQNGVFLPYQTTVDIQDSLFIYLSHLFDKSDKNALSFRDSSRYAIVKRAVEYIRESSKKSITISELAKNAYSSVRSLEYAFQQVLGVTPKRYLVLKRFHQIREDLKAQKTSQVTMLLHQYGVVNCGRFSQDYRKLFGENPKDTLKRFQ